LTIREARSRAPRTNTVLSDQSKAMLEIARRQAPRATFVEGDALALPFEDGAFERLFTSNFYGRLREWERRQFLSEVRRVAQRLVIADSVPRRVMPAEGWEARVLNDGSRWRIYKRYFTGRDLIGELGAGTVLFEGDWFVVVAT
jgi:ubiquinone/menaquinone biosynthesis C-methylase UbiE